ncbi:hypothetical protein QFZ80_003188 [Paenibacillus sp. V4I7]|nr:hypothetical protein [Paenibacillus sp. V4I7]
MSKYFRVYITKKRYYFDFLVILPVVIFSTYSSNSDATFLKYITTFLTIFILSQLTYYFFYYRKNK